MALYLRYSLAGFLKFWLVRWVYEQQAQTDRLLAAMDPDALTAEATAADAVAAADAGLPDPLRPPQPPGASS